VQLGLAALELHRIGHLPASPSPDGALWNSTRSATPAMLRARLASGRAETRRTPRPCRVPGLSATACSTWPSAVKRLSAHSRSR
jgi:hypothetical protein